MAQASTSQRPDDDPDLLAIREFVMLVGMHAKSPKQRERVVRAARVPVTGASLAVLEVVDQHGPLAGSSVASRLGLDQSTTSRHLRPLEAAGLIRRTTDRDDRRVAWLAVTPKGRNLLARTRAVMLNDFDVALSDWSAADRRALAALIDRFRHDLLRTRTDETGWSVGKAQPHDGDR